MKIPFLYDFHFKIPPAAMARAKINATKKTTKAKAKAKKAATPRKRVAVPQAPIVVLGEATVRFKNSAAMTTSDDPLASALKANTNANLQLMSPGFEARKINFLSGENSNGNNNNSNTPKTATKKRSRSPKSSKKNTNTNTVEMLPPPARLGAIPSARKVKSDKKERAFGDEIDSNINSSNNSNNSNRSKTKKPTPQLDRNFYPSIGRGKKLWSEKECEAVAFGVRRFGEGKWAAILAYYSSTLVGRTSVNIKDKWRNMKAQSKRENAVA